MKRSSLVRFVLGIMVCFVLCMSFTATPVRADATTDAAILKQLTTMTTLLQAMQTRVDKLEAAQSMPVTNQPSPTAVNAARTALNRNVAPTGVNTANALNTTRGACANGRCGQN